eukprot:jgi/Undpi1/1669/HiC_scaffold_11.g05059.m1
MASDSEKFPSVLNHTVTSTGSPTVTLQQGSISSRVSQNAVGRSSSASVMSTDHVDPPPGEGDGGDGGEGNVVEAGETGAPAEGGMVQTEQQLSALRDSLARKGKNSYYYAHTRVMDTPSWDGRQAPRRLANADSSPPAAKRPEKVANYAWANEKAKVKIYISVEGCSDIDDDHISLKWEPRCVDLQFSVPSGARRLHIPSLHDDITGATVRKKQDKFILTLMKKDEVTWFDLTSTR